MKVKIHTALVEVVATKSEEENQVYGSENDDLQLVYICWFIVCCWTVVSVYVRVETMIMVTSFGYL